MGVISKCQSGASAGSTAMLPRMTSGHALRSALVDEIPVETIEWFLAECGRCGQELAQPFRDESERDAWAIGHAASTGHIVYLTAERTDATFRVLPLVDEHPSAMIRCFDGPTWCWMCPSWLCVARRDGGPRWNGPYGTGQLALASWRAHGQTR